MTPRQVIKRLLSLGITSRHSEADRQIFRILNACLGFTIALGVVFITALSLHGERDLILIAVSGWLFLLLSLRWSGLGHHKRARLWMLAVANMTVLVLSIPGGPMTYLPGMFFLAALPFALYHLGEWRRLMVPAGMSAVVVVVMLGRGFGVDAEGGLATSRLQWFSFALAFPAWWAVLVYFFATRWRVERQMAEALEASQVANRVKTEFLANVSHELRTPIGAVLGYTELLLGDGALPEERTEFLRTIRRNGRHLLGLIDQVLDLSKVEAGGLEPENVACSPAEAIAEVAGMVRVQATEKGLGFEVYYLTGVPALVRCDPLRVRQILVNLLGNAIKFTDTGEVALWVGMQEEAGVTALRLDVVDSGPGVQSDGIEALFQPFRQGDNTTQRRHGGAGLGLAISRRLAGVLGAHIEVDSTPGEGSTFSLVMPLDAEALAGPMLTIDEASERCASESADHRTPPDLLAGFEVLVAEDAPDNQRLIQIHLRAAGAHVTLVGDGAAALEMAEGQAFDLIILDIQMPKLDGYTATRRMRAAGVAVPILALTAHAMVGERQRCLDAGCTDYLTKPFEGAQLVSCAADLLGAKAGSDPISVEASLDAQIGVLAERFGLQLPVKLSKIEEALDTGDLQECERLAHTLAGSAGSFGYSGVTDAARALEQDLAAGGSPRESFELLVAVIASATER